ncbi:hypothetical protein jhhlp_008339 [Lomentospora prolificans]|uniref:Uncharacterized protein n=1 Tax=Lomentospora prolificans TaxID=41688 RepID=A0A2N3MXS3_9PEZI|nr:hypothetical protein jhhlp_008339 [Lomentospora prolificans]
MGLFKNGKSKGDIRPRDDPPQYGDVAPALSPATASNPLCAVSAPVQPQQTLPPNHNLGAPGYAAPAPAYQAPIPQQFPPVFGVYKDPFSWTLVIGLHRNAPPIYAISRNFAIADRPAIIIHSGPNATYPAVAAMDRLPLTRDRPITMPPLPGSPHPSSEAILHVEAGFFSAKWWFDIETGFPGRHERYEWRRSRGDIVANLGTDWSTGWKLVRLDSRPPEGAPPGTTFSPAADTSASDGAEIVAVWGLNSLSMHKVGMFAFHGTGASGLLGERWAVMAVISALAIMDHEQHRG